MYDMENRINKMEVLFDELNALCDEVLCVLDKFEKNKEKFKILENYYQSDEWMQDYEADEKGLLEMKRGVLSEDGVYDLLMKKNEIMELLNK